jgi:hypothetical protein
MKREADGEMTVPPGSRPRVHFADDPNTETKIVNRFSKSYHRTLGVQHVDINVEIRRKTPRMRNPLLNFKRLKLWPALRIQLFKTQTYCTFFSINNKNNIIKARSSKEFSRCCAFEGFHAYFSSDASQYFAHRIASSNWLNINTITYAKRLTCEITRRFRCSGLLNHLHRIPYGRSDKIAWNHLHLIRQRIRLKLQRRSVSDYRAHYLPVRAAGPENCVYDPTSV